MIGSDKPKELSEQEWHIGHAYAYLLQGGMSDSVMKNPKEWHDSISLFERRFPDEIRKFTDYMGWTEADGHA